MTNKSISRVLALISLLSLLAGCGRQAVENPRWPDAAGTINIDGSSTVFPITEAVAEEFYFEAPNVRVTVGVSGTGGGFKRFCSGETEISNASRPIKESERELCKAGGVEFIELPIAYDGLVVAVNPSNDWVDCITAEELRTIWEPAAQGSIRNWSQIRPEWPNQELRLYGPGTDSGTFDYWTEAIVGESGASRGDYTSSEDDNVLVQGISGDDAALGYFGYGYYLENRSLLKALAVNGGERCVEPTPETIGSGEYQPLSRPIFIYINNQALERQEISAFIQFYIEAAPELVSEVGYIPLPERAYRLASERVEQRIIGSVFSGGAMVGVSVEELLQLEGK